jgi:very-short-patch-repair endonuclease
MPDGKLRYARKLRRQMTDAEHRLWRYLRAHRLRGHKFKRQQPIGPYIVDFVSFEANLIVEVDGSQHQESKADVARDAWLASEGFKILRFWNNDVIGRTEAVLDEILRHLDPSPLPLSPKGRGVQ